MKLRHLLPPSLIAVLLALTAFARPPAPISASAAGACYPSGDCCPSGTCCFLSAPR